MSSLEQKPPSFEKKESKEWGSNVQITLKIMRHGERTPDGKLTDYGRAITRERANASNLGATDFDAVKAIGSNAGPKNAEGMQRSLESADIYAREIDPDGMLQTRPRSILSYEAVANKLPPEIEEMHTKNLPANFDELSDEEKAIAMKAAQKITMDCLVALRTPEAVAYKREVASAYAYMVRHYQEMAHRLKGGSKVLVPAGAHGGTMEFLLVEALAQRDENGTYKVGLSSLDDIGGEFSPSDAYTIDIATDKDGNDKSLIVTFDEGNRPHGKEFVLDPTVVATLAEEYKTMHPELVGVGRVTKPEQ